MQKRQVQRWMIFFLFICNTFVAININVAINFMAGPFQEIPIRQQATRNMTCLNTNTSENSSHKEEMTLNQENTFNWSHDDKRMVLSAYQWLSWLMLLPKSILAQKYGSKKVLGYTFCTSAVISSSIPFLAGLGVNIIIYVRMLQGLLSFLTVPGGIMTIMGNWTSKGDRGRYCAMFLAGSSFGYGLGNYIFEYIGRYLHWQYIFHLTSVCGIVWTAAWYFLITDYPSQHPTMSMKEKAKIFQRRTLALDEEEIPIPWKDILTSIPVAALTLVNVVTLCHYLSLRTFLPIYLENMHGLDSSEAKHIVCISQLICGSWIFGQSWLAYYLIKKQCFSLAQNRKVFNLVGAFLASIPLLMMTSVKCDLRMVIILCVLCTLSRSFIVAGIMPVIVDISPKFCGIVEGIMGTESVIIILAFSTGMNSLSKSLPVEEFWKIVFQAAATMVLIAYIIFAFWGSGEIQPWNEGSKKYQENNDSKKSISPLKPLNSKDGIQNA